MDVTHGAQAGTTDGADREGRADGAGRAGEGARGCSWAEFRAQQPGLARTAEERFGRFTHHTLATLRKDGSPRTSGVETNFQHGELWFGMMPGSYKGRDLRRDPRFALQANNGEGQEMAGGDVRVSGRAVPVDDPATLGLFVEAVEPPEPFELYRVELTEVVRTTVEDGGIALRTWTPGRPLREQRRT